MSLWMDHWTILSHAALTGSSINPLIPLFSELTSQDLQLKGTKGRTLKLTVPW